MVKRDSQLTTTSPSATPINFLTEIPRGPLGKPLYSGGNALDVFSALFAGSTAKQLSDLASDHTKHYVFGRHMTAHGRNGLKFSLLIDGKTIHDGPLDIDALKPDQTIRVCNVRPATVNGETVIVNSAFKRGSAVTLSEIMAARSAKQSATVETPKPAGSIPLGSLPANVIKTVVDAVIANAETPKPKPAAKSAKRKPTAKK